MRRYQIQRLLPLAVSVLLLSWLMTRIPPQALARAASELDWRLLVPATVTMVLAGYLWDAVCLPVVYRIEGPPLGYWRSLHLRGLSYLAGAIHYELGQA